MVSHYLLCACSEEHVILNCYNFFFVDERYNALYIARRTIVSLANCCSASCNRVLSTSSKQAFSLLSKNSWRSRKVESAQLQRAIDLNSEPGASSWLLALPLQDQGYHLTKQEFWDALHLRYGWTLLNTMAITSIPTIRDYRLKVFYNIVYSSSVLTVPNYFTNTTYPTRHHHPFHFEIPFARTDHYKFMQLLPQIYPRLEQFTN